MDEIDTRHARATAARQDTYVDPGSGYFVFTAAYLLRRGTCCGSGCRHCPFDYANVDPSLRATLPPPRPLRLSSPSS